MVAEMQDKDKEWQFSMRDVKLCSGPTSILSFPINEDSKM